MCVSKMACLEEKLVSCVIFINFTFGHLKKCAVALREAINLFRLTALREHG